MPNSRSCDEFSERIQIDLFTLRDPELNAVYNATADVYHVPRELEVMARGSPPTLKRSQDSLTRPPEDQEHAELQSR